jgi:conjugal transfer mating pair stabilization protein TraG
VYTVYAYWNADQVTAVLNAIALTMNGSDYLGLVKALAIAGILVAAGSAIVRMRGEEPLGYFIMFALFYGTLFVPKTTVTVQDLRTATVYTVANVPLGVAFFASETSHFGKWLTETFETNFTSVDDEKFSKTGMAFGARLVEELQLMKVRTPSLQQNLISFVKDCVNPELLDNPTSLNDMVASTDMWGFIGGSGSLALNPGRSVIIDNTAVACTGSGGAYALLTTRLNAEATAQGATLGDRLNAGNSAAQTVIMSQIPAIESSMLNVSRTAQDGIKQSMALNLMRDSQTTVAQLQGNPQAAQVALAVALAEQSSAVSYASMAKVAQGALPKLRNAIELLVIGVFPVVFILIVLAGTKAGMVLKSYVMATLWVQLWAPLYAIINFMATKNDKVDLLGVLHGAGGNTLLNMGELANTALSNQSIAGLLTISVPVIALALVKGGEVAMSGVASSMMAPAQSAAQRAGDAAGQGNVNAGNVSWGNTNSGNTSAGNWSSGNSSFSNASANKQDLSSSWTDPSMSNTTTAHGSFQKDGGGAVTGMRANTWDMGGSISGGSSSSRSNVDSSSEGARATTGRSSSLDLSAAATSSDRSSADFSRQMSTALASRMGTSGHHGETWNAGTGGTASNERGGTSQIQNQDSFKFNSGAGGNVNVGASQNYGPYGGAGSASPSGGHGSGPGQAASLNSGGKSSNPSNLPVAADQVPPQESKAGPISGNKGAGFRGGFAADATSAQAIIDTATNKSGSVDQKSQQHAANIVMSAVNDVMKNTTDSGVRGAAQSFASDFQKAVRASDQQSAAVQRESTAGNTKQQGTSNQIGGSLSMGAPVAKQLMSMAGGDPGAALKLAQDPQALAQATQTAASELKGSSAGAAILGSGGASAPRTAGSVESQGNADVSKLSGKARGAAAIANNENKSAVAAKQPASPMSSPDTSAATAGYSSTAGAAYSAYQSLSGDTSFAKGTTDVAAALYGAEQKGAGTVMANAFGFTSGYSSPQAYEQALTQAAASSPKLASTLQQIGSSGGQVSPQALEYVQSALKSHADTQPGFFSKILDSVTGK